MSGTGKDAGKVIVLPVGSQGEQSEQVELTVREYRGERVVVFSDVDRLHNRPAGTAGRTFRSHRNHFENGVHYHRITGEELTFLKKEFGMSLNPDAVEPATRSVGSRAAELIFLTERGYLKLVKPFTDDRSWEVQDQLITGYFRARELADATASANAAGRAASTSDSAALDIKAADRAVKLVREARLSLPKGSDLWPLIRSAYEAAGLQLPDKLETVQPAPTGRRRDAANTTGDACSAAPLLRQGGAPADAAGSGPSPASVPASMPASMPADVSRPALLVSLAREELAANTHRLLGHPACIINASPSASVTSGAAAAASKTKPLGALKTMPGTGTDGGYIAVAPGELASLVNARLRVAKQPAASATELSRALREVGHLHGDSTRSVRIGAQPVHAWRLPVEWSP